VIAVVDCDMGNLRSVERALRSVGADVTLVTDPDRLGDFERIILPGVGAFGRVIASLREHGFVDALNELVVGRRVPFLGICLGLQLICRESDEHGTHGGLGWVNARVERIDGAARGMRVPHIGWNDVEAHPGSALLPDADAGSFYFVHSYHAVPDPGEEAIVTATVDYGGPLTACIERDNILATQFHPEKSQRLGIDVLRRFVAWQPAWVAD
jgi:glutamine amidotransferase